MAMLAERKRKTKWVLLPKTGPKKPLWSTETEGIKFGKKLMEKMGWSAGKGLGAQEQGIQEPLRVSYKNDTKGMGFKANDDEWISQQDEFNDLLTQLSGNNTDESANNTSDQQKPDIKSLEEMSRQSRSRVHYMKFTRGKDLSRYSENDLACILGTKKGKPDVNENEKKPIGSVESETDKEQSFGVKTIHGGSLVDYFTNKWAEIKKQRQQNQFSNENNSNATEVGEQQVVSNDNKLDIEFKEEKKRKKRKHLMSDDSSEPLVSDDNEVTCSGTNQQKINELKHDNNNEVELGLTERQEQEGDTSHKNSLKKKKKASKDIELSSNVGNLENEENSKTLKKKKKKKLKLDLSLCKADNISNTNDESLEMKLIEAGDGEHKSEKKKKKKKHEREETDAMDLGLGTKKCVAGDNESVMEEKECDIVMNKSKKTKKGKSKENKQDLENDVSNKQEVRDESQKNEEHIETVKKKKRKKSMKPDESIISQSEPLEERKKKKSTSKKGSDEDSVDPEVTFEVSPEENITKKKKKKKDKKETKKEGKENWDCGAIEDSNGESIADVEKIKNGKKKSKTEKSDKVDFETTNEKNQASIEQRKTETLPKQEGQVSGIEETNIIHSHKESLFPKKKTLPLLPQGVSKTRIIKLMYGAQLHEFKGSNLAELDGYGKLKRKEAPTVNVASA